MGNTIETASDSGDEPSSQRRGSGVGGQAAALGAVALLALTAWTSTATGAISTTAAQALGLERVAPGGEPAGISQQRPGELVSAIAFLPGSAASESRQPLPPDLVVPGVEPAAAPEGHVLVSWECPPADAGDPGLTFEVEHGRRADFRDARRRAVGGDRTSFLTGLPEGDTHVRVRAVGADGEPGPWSRSGIVRVRYPSSRLLATLMSLGAVTALALLAIVAIGHRVQAARSRRASEDHAAARSARFATTRSDRVVAGQRHRGPPAQPRKGRTDGS
jgi:hypothetical protein